MSNEAPKSYGWIVDVTFENEAFTYTIIAHSPITDKVAKERAFRLLIADIRSGLKEKCSFYTTSLPKVSIS